MKAFAMQQISFSQIEYAGKKRVTSRERFLGEMEQVVPWSVLLDALTPYYPKVLISTEI